MQPGADGIELMENDPELSDMPVILLYAYSWEQMVSRVLEAGTEDYIVKSFSSTDFVGRIQTVLSMGKGA